MDRMTGSAHQSGSSLPWRQQWVLPGGLDCLGLALGEFRMLEVPFSYSGSYWEFKVSIRGDRFCGYRSLYAGDTHPRSTATHQMQYSRWAVQAVTMTCRLQGRYAGVRDSCRLGIRPSVDQVQSSPDQRGKRENKQRDASCASETYPSHSSCPLFHFRIRHSSRFLKFLYIPLSIRCFNNNQLPIP